jgi:two-component system NtrC family response regulator
VERLAVLARGQLLELQHLPEEIRCAESRVASIGLKLPEEGIDLEQVEKEILLQALEKHGWNQTHAARYLNISRKTLIYRMEKFALLPPTQSAV